MAPRPDPVRGLVLGVMLLALGALDCRAEPMGGTGGSVEPTVALEVEEELDAPDECEGIAGPGADAGSGLLDPPTARFALQFADEVSPYRLISAFVLPGESLELETVLGDRTARFRAEADGGMLERVEPGRWRWTAPEDGVHCVEVTETRSDESICLQVFVMQPYDGAESVNGYRIGSYPAKPLRGNPAFARPRGLVEVTAERAERLVSPHFRLRQFLAKQQSDWPKYLVLRTRLLLKLEMLLGRLRERGVDARTLTIMSGYRTPHYNRSIGNKTRYSRHTYGDAADVYVDRDGDGSMDDLNGDGRRDAADARFLFEMIEEIRHEPWYRPFIGGLGLYGPKPHRGPFIHIDTRGKAARW